MTRLWLVEDLEPFHDRPEQGDVFSPSTMWVHAGSPMLDAQPLPADLHSRVPAVVRRVEDGDRTEWIAELSDGFTTMLPCEHAPGPTILDGYLMWDRYLWLDYRSEPSGRLRLVDREACITRHRMHTASRHQGWFDIVYDGPPTFSASGTVPADHDIQFAAHVVDTDLDDGVDP